MSYLSDIASTFEVPRPIFRLTLNAKCDHIDHSGYEPVYACNPSAKTDDELEKLVVSHYRVDFNKSIGRFSLNAEDIAYRVMDEIRGFMRHFIERNLQMRNPRLSKLYRWLTRYAKNDARLDDAFMMLYKYILSFENSPIESKHINNVMAILHAMEEKFNG